MKRSRVGMLASLALLCLAPAPNDPVRYRKPGEIQWDASVGVDTVSHVLSAPIHVNAGKPFWVDLSLTAPNTLVKFIQASGSILYDSLTSRPTGRTRVYQGRLCTANTIVRGTQQANRCDPVLDTLVVSAMLEGVEWEAINAGARGRIFGVEFQGLNQGTATFSWTPGNRNCWEATIASPCLELDRKPRGTIWNLVGGVSTYVATMTDTSLYRVTAAITSIRGTHTPSRSDLITLLTGSVNATVGDTVTITIAQRTAPTVPAKDYSYNVVWSDRGLTYIDATTTRKWGVSAGTTFSWDDTNAINSTYTTICGVDSARARLFAVLPELRAQQPDGPFLLLRFSVTRAGTWTVKLGCPVPESTGVPPGFGYSVAVHKEVGGNYQELFNPEVPIPAWRHRFTTSGQATVVGL